MCPKILASLEGETLARDFSLLADDIFSCLFLLSLSLFMANREKGAFHIYTLMMKNFSTIMIRKKMVQKKEEGQKIRRKKIHLALSLATLSIKSEFWFPISPHTSQEGDALLFLALFHCGSEQPDAGTSNHFPTNLGISENK